MIVHRCPNCRDKGNNYGFNLVVMAAVECNVQQQFSSSHDKDVRTFPVLPNNGLTATWSGESTMECKDCDYTRRAIEFVQEGYTPS